MSKNMQSESLALIRISVFRIFNWTFFVSLKPNWQLGNRYWWENFSDIYPEIKTRDALPSLVVIFILSQQSESDWQGMSD